jgi:hypothetical protein
VNKACCPRFIVGVALCAAWAAAVAPTRAAKGDAAKGPVIRLTHKAEAGARATFDVVGLDAASLAELAEAKPEPGQWAALFAVYVDSEPRAERADQPPVLGSYRVEDGVLRFEPRFPPAAGLRYRAVFNPARLPKAANPKAEPVVATFTIPKPAAPPTVVEHIYPTRDRLPENQLKFYLHFSAPMSRGEAYRHVHLLDDAGKPVESSFLELGEELWDPQAKRFTLFIDPGRIKRGLKPRDDLGPVLEAGKRYTLVIDRAWSDAQDNPLRDSYRKAFRAVAADEEPPDPKTWKVQPPPAGSARPLTVAFPEPLDHALLQRLLWVTDDRGRKVPGAVTVSDEETRWHFTPERPWQAGAYSLVADTALEDLAGNGIGRPFEVDVARPIQRAAESRTVTVPFVIETAARP